MPSIDHLDAVRVKSFAGIPLTQRRLSRSGALAGMLICAWFLSHSWRGLLTYFSNDDIMNLYWARETPLGKLALSAFVPFTNVYRPSGAILYRSLSAMFGLQPLPFRIVAYALLAVNLVLVYKLTRTVTGRVEAGVLAAFLASFHNRYVDLYLNNGTTYDILCGSFYLAAVYLYVSIRSRNAAFRLWQLGVLYLLATAALNAKETAATLPVVLLIYELVCQAQARPADWPLKRSLRPTVWPILIAGLVMATGTWARFLPDSRLMHNDSYVLHWSAGLPNTAVYLNDLLCLRFGLLHGAAAVAIILGLFGIAALARSRVLLFWALWIVISPLPVTFISQRALYAFYIPVIGWAAFLATWVVLVMDWFTMHFSQSMPRLAPRMSTWFAAAGMAVFLGVMFARDRPIPWGDAMPEHSELYPFCRDLRAGAPSVPPGSHVLLLNDGFAADDWIPLMLARLTYDDLQLELVRPKQRGSPATLQDRKTAAAVFDFVNGRTVRVN